MKLVAFVTFILNTIFAQYGGPAGLWGPPFSNFGKVEKQWHALDKVVTTGVSTVKKALATDTMKQVKEAMDKLSAKTEQKNVDKPTQVGDKTEVAT